MMVEAHPYLVIPNAVRDPPAPQRRFLHGAAADEFWTRDAYGPVWGEVAR